MTRCTKLPSLLLLLILLRSSTSTGFLPSRNGSLLLPMQSLRSNVSRPSRAVRDQSRTVAKMIPIDAITESINVDSVLLSTTQVVAGQFLRMDQDTAETLAGPLFGLSLFPYLGFIYFLNVEENRCPKGVVVGFAACLLFVVLTIPAAIAAKVIYDTSLANCDWLHGSAESMLTITNLATVIPFRRALNANYNSVGGSKNGNEVPVSATSYTPTLRLVGLLTLFAVGTALVPAISHPLVHTKYLNGFMDLPFTLESFGARVEPDNALSVATWIIHVSSLVEFLVAMGFCWRYADVVNNPKWKGLTWGLLPLHSSGITACVSHLFYNHIPILVPLQAFLTCVGNVTAAYAAFRIAISNGWKPDWSQLLPETIQSSIKKSPSSNVSDDGNDSSVEESQSSLLGFEDLGDVLANDNDTTFLIKLFVGCALFSYLIKYGELFFDFPYEASVPLSLGIILIPSALNAYKWNRRSQDSSFKGWL